MLAATLDTVNREDLREGLVLEAEHTTALLVQHGKELNDSGLMLLRSSFFYAYTGLRDLGCSDEANRALTYYREEIPEGLAR